MEEPITFRNRNKCQLFGMLYTPPPEFARGIGVLICVNAVKYRLGTFRMHTLLARKLVALGYAVLSFDPEGIGDSEGEFANKLLTEHYLDIQVGKYTSDLADAVHFFSNRCTLDKILVFGLCGGAISVLIEAAEDARVDGIILLNLPVLIEDVSRKGVVDNAAKITSSESAASLLKGKIHRLVEIDFWVQLARLKIDIREEGSLVWKAIKVIVAKTAAQLYERESRSREALAFNTPLSKNPLFNKYFQRAFVRAMDARKPTLFVFAELDAWTWIFKSEFQDRALQPGHPYDDYCDVKLIKGANHIFSARQSQIQLTQCIVTWLEARWNRDGSDVRSASAI